jgi:hypothetical protein
MDKYKVGQKVRVARRPDTSRIPIGAEAVITAPRDKWFGSNTQAWRLGYLLEIEGAEWMAEEWQLEPLLAPGFDQFMERVMKPVDLRNPVTA